MPSPEFHNLSRLMVSHAMSDLYLRVRHESITSEVRTAGLTDVLRRIKKVVYDDSLAEEMVNRVVDYFKTKNDKHDLSKREQDILYRDVDYGEFVKLTNKRNLDIDWTNHAEYRSDLRDVPAKQVNQYLTEKMREKLIPQKGKVPKLKSPGSVKFKENGIGTMVVDYDLTRNPADLNVITVWASQSRRSR
jgi:hypothetical protein